MSVARLSEAANRKKDRVRTFIYQPAAKYGHRLAVTLKYLPPDFVREELARGEAKIVTNRSGGSPIEPAAYAKAQDHLTCLVLSDAVVKVQSEEFQTDDSGKVTSDRKPVTWRHIVPLVDLDPDEVAKHGGLDGVVPFDTTSTNKDEASGSRENMVWLMGAYLDFRSFVEKVAMDVSWFHADTFEDEVKNSAAAKTA